MVSGIILHSFSSNKLLDFHKISCQFEIALFVGLCSTLSKGFIKRMPVDWIIFAAGLVDSVWHSLSSKRSFMGKF